MRVAPQNIEAEMTVLGAILLDNERIDDAATLTPADFYRPNHREIFAAMQALSAKNEPIDPVTLATELGGHEHDEPIRQAMSVVPFANRIHWGAKEVLKASEARALITAAQDAMEKAYERDMDAAMGIVSKIGMGDRTATRLVRADQLAPRGLRALEAEQAAYKAGHVSGVPTGLWDVDSLLAGLKPQDYAILAARPSMGKTSLALEIALNAAKAGFPGFIASLEMSAEKLFTRALSLLSDIPISHLRRDQDDHGQPLDADKVTEASTAFMDLPLYIEDSGAQRPAYIRSIARQVRRKSKAEMGLIVVDHLNIAVADAKGQNRNHDLTEISAAMKALAKDIGWPVLALCQLSRKCEERTDKRPMLSDLRESGALEQDADIVMGLYREAYYNDHAENPHKAELIVLKNRDGECRTIPLHWDGRKTKFSDWSSI
ncbi:MAG: replicative DNA helicase [Chrysiogenetes bacterium]|nr:replicative DNA helicase [Chrysiogenetes bacterium]